jgi:hypothetical protein
MIHKILYFAFAVYLIFTQALIFKYDKINDDLLASMNTLLAACTNHKLYPEEELPYEPK